MGASVAGLVVSAWPYLLYLLTPEWRFWSVDDLGGLPFLLMGSGFSGALVFVLILWRRVGWGSGVLFSSVVAVASGIYVLVKHGAFPSLRLLELVVTLVFVPAKT